jgi:hypothetical protein
MESGGRDDAISPSDACGVAQWLASTGKANGLRVDEKTSKRLTAKINPLKRKIAWLNYLSHPNANPNAAGAPAISQAEAQASLPLHQAELEFLKAKRRSLDFRFDPRKAIFAQTRYLVRLYKRFPGLDWLYQAYHGGEGGAKRSLKLYLGGNFNSTANAVRRGNGGGRLRWEDVYTQTTPTRHAAAFRYIYGRSDDHRHYWYKLRICQNAIARYRADTEKFRKEWQALLPGRSKEVYWYPDALSRALPTEADKLQARTSGRLSAQTTMAGQTVTASPETWGAFGMVEQIYRQNGGKQALWIETDWLSQARAAELRAVQLQTVPLHPTPPDQILLPLADTLPPDFDFHTTGLALDIRKPDSLLDRKILDYALGWLEDREIIWRLDRKNAQPPSHHFVPNPRFADALRSRSSAGGTTNATAAGGKTLR